jgi:hypothetical protein
VCRESGRKTVKGGQKIQRLGLLGKCDPMHLKESTLNFFVFQFVVSQNPGSRTSRQIFPDCERLVGRSLHRVVARLERFAVKVIKYSFTRPISRRVLKCVFLVLAWLYYLNSPGFDFALQAFSGAKTNYHKAMQKCGSKSDMSVYLYQNFADYKPTLDIKHSY